MLFILLGEVLGWIIGTICTHVLPVAVNNPLGILASNGNPAPWVDAMAAVGLYVDLPFLFAALGVFFGWKVGVLVVKAWQMLLRSIPFVG